MKTRRKFLSKVGGLSALLALGPASSSLNAAINPGKSSAGSKELEGSFVHIVFFWLVDGTPEVRVKFLDELKRFLRQVEVLKEYHIGPPADTDREVIDNSYSICLVTTFDSMEDHDIYQAHKAHKEFIENASGLWKKVLVYDSVRS